MRSIFLAALFLGGCATGRVGNGDSLRIPASHYQSMAGVALKDGDSASECKREMITGSHIPRWYCRFGEDATQYGLVRRVALDVR